MTSGTIDTTRSAEAGLVTGLLSLQTASVSVELAAGVVRVSCVDDAGPGSRGARAVAEWLSDELGEEVAVLALPGRVGVELRSGVDEHRIVAFAVAALDTVYTAEHPMRRFGELAAGGAVVARLGRPLDEPAVKAVAAAVVDPPRPAEANEPAAQPRVSASAAPRVRFEWIGPIASGPIQPAPSPAVNAVPPSVAGVGPATGEVVAESSTAAAPASAAVASSFVFGDLPAVDAPGLFDVWMDEAGDDPVRTREVLARVLACEVLSIEERCATLPARLVAGVSAREVRRIEASLRYTTRAGFRAAPAA